MASGGGKKRTAAQRERPCIALSPDKVREAFGAMFSQGLLTIVDEAAGVARIIESCSVRGPVEWDAANRLRAGGAIERIRVDGNSLVMDARLGAWPVRFGPSDKKTGGQALKSVHADGQTVRTRWLGLAGASVGIGACLAQAPGVLRAEYHTDKIRLGGSHEIEVTLTTPLLHGVTIGIDDTDTRETGATWALALKFARGVEGHIRGARFLQHRIVQLYPGIKEKTTNCTSTALIFAVAPGYEADLACAAEDFLRVNTSSKNTSMGVLGGLQIPKPLLVYGKKAKAGRMTLEMAQAAAKKSGVRTVRITGDRGLIGALAAIGCSEMGPEAAALAGERL